MQHENNLTIKFSRWVYYKEINTSKNNVRGLVFLYVQNTEKLNKGVSIKNNNKKIRI